MANIWFTSDHHFSHANFLRFTDENGRLIRPFDSVEEMNELMIQRWNEVVKDGDKVWHGGDFSFRYGNDLSRVLYRLKGQKRLVIGNHDRIKGTNLLECFSKVELWRGFKEEGFLLTHLPTHPDSFRGTVLNVHGHIHQREVLDGKGKPDPRYFNVSVERHDYYPVPMETIIDRVKKLR